MFNYLLYRIGQFIALSLPLKIAYKIAIFISDLRYLVAWEDKRVVRENLKAIFPQKTDKEIKRMRLAMFRNFAKYLVDFFCFTKLDKEWIEKKIKMKNIRYLDEALAEGKGVIILSAHIGNWELGGAALSLLGYKLWAVVLPHQHRKVDLFFNRQRESKKLRVIPLGNSLKKCFDVFKKNHILALVADRDFSKGGGIRVDFFGKPTYLPKGPAVFSLKTGAPIIPGFIVRNNDDTFTLEFLKPIEVVPLKEFDSSLRELVQRYKLIIEDYIRSYPQQWFMFRRFWI